MKNLEEKALKHIRTNKSATEYVKSMLLTNIVFIVILLIEFASNINKDDMFIFWCNVVIFVGVVSGIIANLIVILKLSRKK